MAFMEDHKAQLPWPCPSLSLNKLLYFPQLTSNIQYRTELFVEHVAFMSAFSGEHLSHCNDMFIIRDAPFVLKCIALLLWI